MTLPSRILRSQAPPATPLIAAMVVAFVSTKIPVLLGHGFWSMALRDLPTYGFWSMAHEARNDVAMLLGSLLLLLVGAGPWSVDRRRADGCDS